MKTPLDNGAALHALAARLVPFPRSITGPGVVHSLEVLAEHAPLAIESVPTGSKVLDWTVPAEWHLRSARLLDPAGRTVVDTADNLLHVLNFSVGFRGRLSLQALRPHLFSLADRPDAIPYRTSYYRETWGLCLPHRLVEQLVPGEYEIDIDAEHRVGALHWGELLVPGASDTEVLFSTHCCHPQMANDNLSGMVVMTALAAALARRDDLRHSYRFLFIPGTIGAIAWLATRRAELHRVAHGLVAAGLGDAGAFHYKRTRQGDAPIDSAVPRALRRLGLAHVVEPFVPFGYDERQFNSPGFALPVGSLTRTPWGRYPEYHTSADDLGFVRPESLEQSLAVYLAVVDELERREVWRNLAPEGEPMLGRRGLYRSIGGDDEGRERELALLWVLNQSDGTTDLATIAERSGLPRERIDEARDALAAAGLLERLAPGVR